MEYVQVEQTDRCVWVCATLQPYMYVWYIVFCFCVLKCLLVVVYVMYLLTYNFSKTTSTTHKIICLFSVVEWNTFVSKEDARLSENYTEHRNSTKVYSCWMPVAAENVTDTDTPLYYTRIAYTFKYIRNE